MILLKYDKITEIMFGEYTREWLNKNESIIPSVIDVKNKTFNELKDKLILEEKEEIRKKGLVPAILYYLVENNRILGAIHLRHDLNDYLRNYGGHIGYGVRPSERQKGYSVLMLKMLLEIIKKSDLKRVLITCNDLNIGSSRTIEKCGGILENKLQNENELTRRYWIDLN